jgi:hypothetical protein
MVARIAHGALTLGTGGGSVKPAAARRIVHRSASTRRTITRPSLSRRTR